MNSSNNTDYRPHWQANTEQAKGFDFPAQYCTIIQRFGRFDCLMVNLLILMSAGTKMIDSTPD